MNESTLWQNHAREVQLTRIVDEVQVSLEKELDEARERFTAYDHLMTTPPFLLPSVINSPIYSYQKEIFYQEAAKGAQIAVKMNQILEHLLDIGVAIKERPNCFGEIILDADQTVPPELTKAFEEYPNLLNEIVKHGKEEAILGLLNFLSGNPPLLRYRKDLIEKRIALKKSIDNGQIGYLPTRVPNIEVKYWYPGKHHLPQVSLVVKPFE